MHNALRLCMLPFDACWNENNVNAQLLVGVFLYIHMLLPLKEVRHGYVAINASVLSPHRFRKY